MEYAQSVVTARSCNAAAGAKQWQLARITYDVLVVRQQATLTKWAEDVGISKAYASGLRDTWARFGVQGPEQPTKLSFNECYERATRRVPGADPDDDVATARRKRLEHMRLRSAQALVRDPRRARDLVEDPEARRVIEQVLRERRRTRSRESADAQEPAEQLQFDFREDLAAVEEEAYAMLAAMLERSVAKGERRSLAQRASRVSNGFAWMAAYWTTGDESLEDALKRALARRAPLGPPPSDPEPKQPRERDRGRAQPPPPEPGSDATPPADTAVGTPPEPTPPPKRERPERKGPRRRLEPIGSR